MTPRRCPACESTRDLLPSTGGFHRCSSCGLRFAEPREPAPGGGPPAELRDGVLRFDWRGLDALGGLPVKAYDSAVLDDALDRAPEPREALALVRRALKRGGRLELSVPNADRPAFLARGEHDAPPPRVTVWTARALEALLNAGGFEDVRVHAPGPSARWIAARVTAALLAPAAEAAAVRVLFGPEARGTLDGLYAAGAALPSAAPPDGLKGFFADGARRDACAAAFRAVCALPSWAAALLLWPVLRARRGGGETLAATARTAS